MAKRDAKVLGTTGSYQPKYMSAYNGRYRPLPSARVARVELERLRSGRGGSSDPDHMLKDTAATAAMVAAPAGLAAMTGMSVPVAVSLLAAPVAEGSAIRLAEDLKRGTPLHDSPYLLPAAMSVVPAARTMYKAGVRQLNYWSGRGPSVVLPIGERGAANLSPELARQLPEYGYEFPSEERLLTFVKAPLTRWGREVTGDATMLDKLMNRFTLRTSAEGTPIGKTVGGRGGKIVRTAYPSLSRDGIVLTTDPPGNGTGPANRTAGTVRGFAVTDHDTMGVTDLARADGRGRGTFAHEFKHLIERRENLSHAATANDVLDPGFMFKYPDEAGKAVKKAFSYRDDVFGSLKGDDLLDKSFYGASGGEITSRIVGEMSQRGTTDPGRVLNDVPTYHEGKYFELDPESFLSPTDSGRIIKIPTWTIKPDARNTQLADKGGKSKVPFNPDRDRLRVPKGREKEFEAYMDKIASLYNPAVEDPVTREPAVRPDGTYKGEDQFRPVSVLVPPDWREKTALRNPATGPLRDPPFDADYDYVAAFLAGAEPGINPSDGAWHMSDVGKMPTHETFSNESYYARDPKWAPYAGRWEGETYIPPRQAEVRQDAKGGEDRFSMSRNFLATDKVPDTIFGIPVVSRREDYTEADLRFFRDHPEAGGYYDLGEETPEDGSEEGAPVQADMPKRGKYPGSLNNPGNVEKRRTRRAGEVDSPHDRWAKFDTPQNGLAASAAVVREIAESKLAAERKPFTIRNYAEKYAPRSENDTDAYVRNLSKYSGIGADDVLDLWDTDAMSRLLRAKVRFESGVPHSQWFTDDEYRAAAEAMKEGAVD